MVTINDLRKDWIRQIEAYDDMIAFLEREKQRGVANLDLGKPGRIWDKMLHTWRAELQQLLVDYPEER